jgi:hypothetical protein
MNTVSEKITKVEGEKSSYPDREVHENEDEYGGEFERF